jgi:hypothetical protein
MNKVWTVASGTVMSRGSYKELSEIPVLHGGSVKLYNKPFGKLLGSISNDMFIAWRD